MLDISLTWSVRSACWFWSKVMGRLAICTARVMAFCRSWEYWLVPVKFELEVEPEELEVEVAVNPLLAVAAEVREPIVVPINDSRAGQDKSSYPAREG